MFKVCCISLFSNFKCICAKKSFCTYLMYFSGYLPFRISMKFRGKNSYALNKALVLTHLHEKKDEKDKGSLCAHSVLHSV